MKKNIYIFSKKQTEGSKELVNVLGGKGANLAEMCHLGIPVPPGFTISTEVCNYYLENNSFPKNFKNELLGAIKKIEDCQGAIFGDLNNPLLFSIRSGARQSMPGMMETVLNVGLTKNTIQALIKKTGNEHFVYDSYRRLIMMYSDVVMEKANQTIKKETSIREKLDSILIKKKNDRNIENDCDLSVSDLKNLCDIFKDEINNTLKMTFPDDPFDQLWDAIKAVFISWNGKRAVKYRQIENIPNNWGTAVNIQSMVFGNMGHNSATGVAFTRNPSTGENKFYGEWMPNAQGEDVVAGIRTPYPVNDNSKNDLTKSNTTLEQTFPDVYSQLISIKETLETHYNDMQDIEFTIQNKNLYMLQTRSGKRNGTASIKIALDLLQEKKIDEIELIKRLRAKHIEEVMHPAFDKNMEQQAILVTSGLPAGPGCAVGQAVFTSQDAEIWAKRGHDVILIREETSPEDIHGMHASNAIITSRGGMTSHAALVARGWGKCCVVGCLNTHINIKQKTLMVNEHIIKEGDWISINGTVGNVYLDKINLIDTNLEKNTDFNILLQLCKSKQKMGVRANADTPEDAQIAKKMGARGIGLCRTEHMFFEPSRIKEMRKMILFKNDAARRKKSIMNLLPYQKNDFYEILKSMSPYPVTIRLLDPPLHEFLPQTEAQINSFAKETDTSINEIKDLIEQLYENNPMLGHRGCRLGISYPEITEMQSRAILEAASKLINENIEVHPEIMIPLVGSTQEFINQKNIIQSVGEKIEKEKNIKIDYKIGTMIELPRACLIADKIAESADFFSFGTNDLTQTTFGFSRDDVAPFLNEYIKNDIIQKDPFQSIDVEGVGQLVKMAVKKARGINSKIKIGICGEHGGDPDSINFFYKSNLDYVSCSPFRVPVSVFTTSKL